MQANSTADCTSRNMQEERQRDEASVAEARAVVVEKLTALEVSRKAERDKRKEESQAKAAPHESITTFLADFNAQQHQVTSRLDALQQAFTAGTAGEPQQVQDTLDELAQTVLQMEKAAANASYFLPSYDLKQCTATCTDLKLRIETSRTEFVPKRKFAFSKKVNRVKGTELSAAAAEANPVNVTPASAGGTSVIGRSAAEAGSEAASGPSVGAVGSAPTPPTPSQHDLALIKEGRGLMDLQNEVVILTSEQIAGRDFVLINLRSCRVYLLGHLPALRLLGLTDTLVMAGPVTGACFADGLSKCTILLASYQVRIHQTYDTDFYLRVRSKPIIEHTSRVRFAPLVIAPAAVEHEAQEQRYRQLLEVHKLGQESEMFLQVEDFGWIKSVQSPNWSILPDSDRAPSLQIPWGSVKAQTALSAAETADEI